MRRWRRARAILGAMGTMALFASCAASSAPPPAARAATAPAVPGVGDLPATAQPVAEVFDVIEREYVSSPDFARIRLSALRALAATLPPERYVVTEAGGGARVDYEPAGGTRAHLTLTGAATAREAARDVGRAVDAAAAVTPGVDPVARNHAMFARVLRDLDAEAALLEPHQLRETGGGETGLVLGRRDGALLVIDVVEGSPAGRADIRPGERILAVNGVDVREQKTSLANNRLRGAVGTRVTVGLRRPDAPAAREVTLTRAAVTMPVLVIEDLGGGIVRLGPRRFTDRAPRLLAAALDEHARAGMRAIVLDLRDNPGGLLTVAVEVAELFLEPHRLITYTEGRQRTANMRFAAQARPQGTGGYLTQPMVVLVNEESAGASEIVAAALQEWGRAPVVGATTSGRGSIQIVVPLSSGGALKLTNAYLFTPKGRRFEGRGVTPDIPEPSSADLAVDPPLRRAIELLAAKLPNA